jgi:hypothetical protein
LEKNKCSIPNYALNSEVKDLPERVKDRIKEPFRYACRSWYKHLAFADREIEVIVPALRQFLEEKFLFWLETLSVLGAARDTVRALDTTTKWLNDVR